MNKSKRLLCIDILRALYFSMVQSHFTYWILTLDFGCHRIEKSPKDICEDNFEENGKYKAHSEPLKRSMP